MAAVDFADIEDLLKNVAFIRGHKWTSMMVKRVYFGNWLRDYSQAVDVGSLKGVQAPTIRILVSSTSWYSAIYTCMKHFMLRTPTFDHDTINISPCAGSTGYITS